MANETLLSRETHGKTQNQNNTLNSIIWALCPQPGLNKKGLK